MSIAKLKSAHALGFQGGVSCLFLQYQSQISSPHDPMRQVQA